MIIDAHTHAHPHKDGFGSRYDSSIEGLIRDLEESEVDKAIVFPIAATTGLISPISNRFVAECCEKYPDKLIGFAAVHPVEDEDPVGALERDVARFGLRGLKVHPRRQGISAAEPKLVPVVAKAAELNIPVAIDCMLGKPTPLRDQLPLTVDDLCKAVPDAKVIMCHAGGWRFMDALAVAVANDNVYLDLSVSLEYFHQTPFEDQFIFMLKQVGAERLIYGSDFPEHSIKDSFVRSRAILVEHGFSEEELSHIFSKNILSLIG